MGEKKEGARSACPFSCLEHHVSIELWTQRHLNLGNHRLEVIMVHFCENCGFMESHWYFLVHPQNIHFFTCLCKLFQQFRAYFSDKCRFKTIVFDYGLHILVCLHFWPFLKIFNLNRCHVDCRVAILLDNPNLFVLFYRFSWCLFQVGELCDSLQNYIDQLNIKWWG